MWKVVYKKSVQKDLKSIPGNIRILIKRTIEEKLIFDPVNSGKPLRGTLKGLMKRRVGDYRIIYSVKQKTITVFVIKVGHRKEVYKKMHKGI